MRFVSRGPWYLGTQARVPCLLQAALQHQWELSEALVSELMHNWVSEGKAVRVTSQEGTPGRRGGPWSWNLSWGEHVRKMHWRRSRLPGERRCRLPRAGSCPCGFRLFQAGQVGASGPGKEARAEAEAEGGNSLSWAWGARKDLEQHADPVELGLGPQWECKVRVTQEREKVMVEADGSD